LVAEFDSLPDAAGASFPLDSCRVLAIQEHGDAGYALFDTRPGGEPYLYEVHYARRDGRWSEGSSSNGPGWHLLDPDTELGVVTVWGEAPPGADRVRVELDGERREEPVANGVYLVVWWDVPCPATPAAATSFRVRGEWVLGPTWGGSAPQV